MFINSHIARSGCFSWHTKCHRAFDKSLRSGCVADNKKYKKVFATRNSFTHQQKRKTVNLAMQIMSGNRLISLLNEFPSARGLVALLLLMEGQRGKSLQRMPWW